jgi:hypothetical protein
MITTSVVNVYIHKIKKVEPLLAHYNARIVKLKNKNSIGFNEKKWGKVKNDSYKHFNCFYF